MELVDRLSIKNERKLLLFVIDGIGGTPKHGRTELETADTPNLDALAERATLGLTEPISAGITPGSGPAHLALFGYDPLTYEIGRGVLEALGVGLKLGKRDIAVRGNFATLNEDGIVIDRRAGRIPSEKNIEICQRLQEHIRKIEDVEIIIHPGKEHRFVVLFRGDGLYPEVVETDPQKEGEPPLKCIAKTEESEKTARVVRGFIQRAREILSAPANMLLLRGFAKHPNLPTMHNRFRLSCACIATYPMYKGLARLVGMEVLESGNRVEDDIEALRENWHKFNFFYLHIKRADSLGEDGNFTGKVRFLEEVDAIIPDLLSLSPDVLVVTGDHSTPSVLRAHSWHPNPFLLFSDFVIPDGIKNFTERDCARGGFGRFPSLDVLPLMLAHGLKLKKYGA